MPMRKTRLQRAAGGFGAALVLFSAAGLAQASDLMWDNGGSDMLWNTSSLNWSGSAWSNAAGDGAVFVGFAPGTITVPGPITVRSLDFQANGYVLAGPGPLNLTDAGSSLVEAGAISVSPGVFVTTNAPISSSMGLAKLGEGVLELGGSHPITGSVPPMIFSGGLEANIQIGAPGAAPFVVPSQSGGTLTLLNGSALPPTTTVRLVKGILDIGGNNVTLAGLNFPNLNAGAATQASVIGSGTLTVTGDIHIHGAQTTSTGGAGAVIETNLNLGGGTQVVRVGSGPGIALERGCRFWGSLSNGSLFVTIGHNQSGLVTSADGISLHGNNTYTGSTVLNSRTSVATGTNASGSLTVCGMQLSLMSMNGSFLGATTIEVIGGGILRLNNNAAVSLEPSFPAFQNDNRVRDDAAVTLRDGGFAYDGFNSVEAAETFGSLTVSGGHNTVTITPNGTGTGGTATLTCAGNLSLASRATLAVSGTTLGGFGRVFINGTMPAADATGILPRMVGSADFLTYNGTTGLTPYTGYATDFLTPGANVAVAAASAVPASVTINALKSTGAVTTTIGGGNVLGIGSGMVFSTSGTHTFADGTLAFGGTPGVFFGTNVVNSAVTGTQGVIAASGTQTFAGNLSGLSGAVSVHTGTLNLNTDTFAGPFQVRGATLKPNVSLSAGGPISLGVSEMAPDLVATPVSTLDFSNAAVTSIDRDIVIDAGTETLGGVPLARSFSLMTKFTPNSNSTGNLQTFNGDITLNTPVNLQGGGATGAAEGATIFAGTISGPSLFYTPNGRVIFTPSSVLSNEQGVIMGNGGNTSIVFFQGTAVGDAPLDIIGGNNTSMRYAGPGSLFSGPITIRGGVGNTAPRIVPLSSSTIGNQFNLDGDAIPVVSTGLTATWSGPLTGAGGLSKTTVTSTGLTDNTGTLILSSGSNTYNGTMTVGAGTLVVDGAFPGASAAVNSGGTLGGSGSIGGSVTVNAGGTLAPGSSAGTIDAGNLSVAGTLACEVGTGGADLVDVTGAVTLDHASVLTVAASSGGTFIIVQNDESDAVSGTFGTVPAGVTVNYAFTGTDSLGRVGDGNEIAISAVPSCYANCDGSTQTPVLNVADFTCFLQRFAAGEAYANCDESTTVPVLNVADFTCFLQKFAAGCP